MKPESQVVLELARVDRSMKKREQGKALFLFLSRVRQMRGLLCLLIFVLQGCEIPPEVNIQPTSPPSFTFSRGTLVGMLLVYRLDQDQPKRGVFLDVLLADKPNIFWMIEGKHDQRFPIAYGDVPAGMKETVKARPLVEGECYLVFVESLVSATFLVRNGRAERVK
jgi:hypothetical protein